MGYEEGTALFGPNATGKTTLLKTIIGYEEIIMNGEIYFEGKRIDGLKSYERANLGLGFCHQIPPELEGIKVEEMKKEVGVVEEFPELYERFKGRECFKNMSGGERKLLELYLTLIKKPKCLLLDEIDSGVDFENLEKIKEVLNKIGKRICIIGVSHSLSFYEGLKFFKKGVLLVDGQIKYVGEFKEVYDIVKNMKSWSEVNEYI